MKKITLLFLITIGVLKSQTNISSDEFDVCKWFPTDNYVDECVTVKQPCLFFVNKAETMIIHTTPTLKSTYYVQNKNYFEDTKTFVYNVNSDVGNSYVIAIDFKKSQVRIFLENGNNDSYMSRYYIKSAY